jgi:hypothetical protein
MSGRSKSEQQSGGNKCFHGGKYPFGCGS